MRDSSSVRRRVEPTESLFPDTEAPSFCLRPTPLVPPPSDELRDFGREQLSPDTSGTHLLSRPSSRPTVGPGELPPFPHSPSRAPADTPDDVLIKTLVCATAAIPTPAPPLLASASEAPTRPRRNVRRVVARGILLLLIGGLLGLFGYARAPGLASAVHQLQARIAAVAATR